MRLLIAGLLLATACASVGARASDALAPVSFLVVQNARSEDMWIYVERDGVRGRRVGLARGYHGDTLRLTAPDLSDRTTVAFVAIGTTTGETESSHEATSQVGASYRWDLGALPGRSLLSLRSLPAR